MAETYLQRQQRLEGAKQQIQAGYRASTGREASGDEVMSQLGGGGNFDQSNVDWALGQIANSDEARAYAARPTASAAPATPQTAPPNLATAASAAPSAATAAQPPAPAGRVGAAVVTAPQYQAPPPSAGRSGAPRPTGEGQVAIQPSSVYTPGSLAAKVAGPGFTQYTNPDGGQVPTLNRELIERILANPETMSPDMVNQLKSRGRDSALAMAGQLRDGAHADVASRGFSDVGGMRAGFDRAIDSQMIDDIINSNRDIDITAAATNRGDQLAALGAGEDFENALAARADSNYRARLLGESTASDDVFRNNTLDVDRFKVEEAVKQAGDTSAFRNDAFRYDQMRDDRNQTLQEYLGMEGIDLDWARLDSAESQFGRSLGENARQSNNQLGYQYSSLSAQQQSRLMEQIDSILNGK